MQTINLRQILLTSGLLFAVTVCTCEAKTPNEAVGDEVAFKEIFDGKTLAGWDGNPELWQVVDGVIVGETHDSSPLKKNEFLIWKGEVKNFRLRLQFKIADQGVGNSGIQYRSEKIAGKNPWRVKGYQADIERTNTHMGILYEEGGRGIIAKRGQKVIVKQQPDANAKAKCIKEVVGSLGNPDDILSDVKPGEWNTYEIIADGNLLVHKINGHETIRVTDKDTKNARNSGLLALQLHRGAAMQIEFRNLQLSDLDATATIH